MYFMDLTAGDLRHKVNIQHKVPTMDSEGILKDGFADYIPCYAAVIHLSGHEVFMAQATQGVSPVLFRVRYNANVDNTMRVSYLGNYFRITDICDVNGRHKELQIITLQEVQNG